MENRLDRNQELQASKAYRAWKPSRCRCRPETKMPGRSKVKGAEKVSAATRASSASRNQAAVFPQGNWDDCVKYIDEIISSKAAN